MRNYIIIAVAAVAAVAIAGFPSILQSFAIGGVIGLAVGMAEKK